MCFVTFNFLDIPQSFVHTPYQAIVFCMQASKKMWGHGGAGFQANGSTALVSYSWPHVSFHYIVLTKRPLNFVLVSALIPSSTSSWTSIFNMVRIVDITDEQMRMTTVPFGSNLESCSYVLIENHCQGCWMGTQTSKWKHSNENWIWCFGVWVGSAIWHQWLGKSGIELADDYSFVNLPHPLHFGSIYYYRCSF